MYNFIWLLTNKYLEDNKEDYKFFEQENYQISPNPLVKRHLNNKLFGKPTFLFQN